MTEETKVIRFDFSKIGKRMKWKDIKMVRKFKPGSDFDIEQIQILACRFMTNEAGEYLPFQQAFDAFDELSKEESDDVLTRFTEAMKESSVPNVNAERLNSISEVSSPTPQTFPTGSTPPPSV